MTENQRRHVHLLILVLHYRNSLSVVVDGNDITFPIVDNRKGRISFFLCDELIQ